MQKILVTIPHYYRAEEKAPYGSLEKNPSRRILSLTAMLHSLQSHFKSPQCTLHIASNKAKPANQNYPYQLDIVICTTNGHHLLQQLSVNPASYSHYASDCAPRLLGFECQSVLKDNLGKYDYYCFMEDDLIIHDPLFFHKLTWFTNASDNLNLLQPNRYEVSEQGPFFKGYIDGEISLRAGAPYQNVHENTEISGSIFGMPLVFRRTTNPHSGCYFLNAQQMDYWASQPYYLDRDTGFVDPMASAATLGITKTFRVYKPAIENAAFLEIEHYDRRYLTLAGKSIPIDREAFYALGYK